MTSSANDAPMLERTQPPALDEGAVYFYAAEPDDGVSLLHVINALLRHRYTVLLLAMTGALVFGLVAVLSPVEYSASASFMPESRSEPRMAGLASQLGLITSASGQSPAFYADLLTTRTMLRETVRTTYSFESGARRISGTLHELYGEEIKATDPALRERAAMGLLRQNINPEVDRETGMVEVEVEAPWPELAEQVTTRLLQLVNLHNLERRAAQAAAETAFISERLEEAKQALAAAEAELQSFLAQNRKFDQFSSARFEYERLQRAVMHQQQLYMWLAEAHEQGRIDAMRTTPVIQVIDSAEDSARRKSHRLALLLVLGTFGGALVGVVMALLREYFRRARAAERAEFRQFEELRSDVLGDLRRIGGGRGLG